jgi:hypothetical protein
VIDQFDFGRVLIKDAVVTSTGYIDVEAGMTRTPDPDPAWVAADLAFDADVDDVPGSGDELARALLAAAPFHRADELDERILELKRELELLPGFRNTWRREGLEIALARLEAQRDRLRPGGQKRDEP